jgi:hypothetical protein
MLHRALRRITIEVATSWQRITIERCPNYERKCKSTPGRVWICTVFRKSFALSLVILCEFSRNFTQVLVPRGVGDRSLTDLQRPRQKPGEGNRLRGAVRPTSTAYRGM